MENNKKGLISQFKTRIILPFYIKNINDLFFDINHQNSEFIRKTIPNLEGIIDEDEIEKVMNQNKLTDALVVKKILNKSIANIDQIIKINGQSIFYTEGVKDLTCPYVKEKQDTNDLDVVGSVDLNYRYNYNINLNKNSPIFRLAEQIQFSFFLDQKTKTAFGGISLNWGKISKLDCNSFDLKERVYLSNLMKTFTNEKLKKLSFDFLLDLFESSSTTSEFDKKNKTVQRKSNKETYKESTNLTKIHLSWIKFINKKFLDFKKIPKEEVKYYENDLFFAAMMLYAIGAVICEDLNIFFCNHDPNSIVSLLENAGIENKKLFAENSSMEESFSKLIKYLKVNYSYKNRIDYKKIRTRKAISKALESFFESDNQKFSELVISYEFTREDSSSFLDEDVDFFMNNDDFKIIFLLLLKQEIFGLNDNELNFVEYDEFVDFTKSIKINDEWNKLTSETIEETSCEWNYDYATFINKNLSFLIVKNNNPIFAKAKGKTGEEIYEQDANRRLYNNYLWAQVFSQLRILILREIENKFSESQWKNPELLRNYLAKIHEIDFDWNNNFYGLSEIKTIVKKINELSLLKYSLKILEKKINANDKNYGKTKQRIYTGLALMSAGLFGITDFFTMVFSVLTVQRAELGLSPVNIAFIVIGGFFSLVVLFILGFAILKLRKTKERGN